MLTPLGPLFRHIVRVFAATAFATDAPVPVSRLDWLMEDWADFTRYMGTKSRIAFAAGILAVQCLPFLIVFRPVPMTWLSEETRRRYLEKLEASSLTFLITAVKVPLTLLYFEHPDVVGLTGYDGSIMKPLPGDALHPTAAATKARLAVLGDPRSRGGA